MIGMERIDAPGKAIKELNIGDTFTMQGRYIPDTTEVYTLELICDDGIYSAKSNLGWWTAFEPDDVVYPV